MCKKTVMQTPTVVTQILFRETSTNPFLIFTCTHKFYHDQTFQQDPAFATFDITLRAWREIL